VLDDVEDEDFEVRRTENCIICVCVLKDTL
jgi:hypothetical protein